MANNYLEQPERTINYTADGKTATVNYKGDYADLKTYADGLTIGASPLATGSSFVLSAADLVRIVGSPNLGTLRLTYTANGSSASSQGAADIIRTAWRMTNTQTEVSILRYCGQSVGANANRQRIEAWMQEPDAGLRAAFEFRSFSGAIIQLTANDLLLAKKISAGIESVTRHYPTIQKETILTRGTIAGIGANLDHIDTPTGAPSGMTSAAAAWMKIGDDLDVAEDGTQTRTESWVGAASFDANLYGNGSDRWEFGTV